jgi:hypothetical protein
MCGVSGHTEGRGKEKDGAPERGCSFFVFVYTLIMIAKAIEQTRGKSKGN